jgi:hypothetical protein
MLSSPKAARAIRRCAAKWKLQRDRVTLGEELAVEIRRAEQTGINWERSRKEISNCELRISYGGTK